jgi:pyruvate dehydrogenase E2 component (dihydrolipoamide acetyltransferase)
VVKVAAAALRVFLSSTPDRHDGRRDHPQEYVIGVAVDTDRGLLVPVIKDADHKNIVQLSVELAQLREGPHTEDRARGNAGRLLQHLEPRRDRRHHFTPIVNTPEVAISASREHMEPVHKDGFVPRFMLPLSLSYATVRSTAPTASLCAGSPKRWNNPSCCRCKGETRAGGAVGG